MKMAEALIERAALQKQIGLLQSRIEASALVQEGDSPAENPDKLLAEQATAMDRLAGLIAQINVRNTEIAVGAMSMTGALAERDRLDKQMKLLGKTVEAAQGGPHSRLYGRRASRTEIRDVATVSIADLNIRIERLAKQRRELDMEIQGANWANDL